MPQNSSRQFKTLVVAGLVIFAAGCVLLIPFPGHKFLIAFRCFGLLLLAAAGLRNRTLTFWIFFAMLAGLELGLDAPTFAVQLRMLSDIFLRLIKVIVAPLILGTLITGIAVAVGSLLADENEIYDLTNIGTLFAFILVCIGVQISWNGLSALLRSVLAP